VQDTERAAKHVHGGAAAEAGRARPAVSVAPAVRVVPHPTSRRQRREPARRRERRGSVGRAREARPARRRPAVESSVAARSARGRAGRVGWGNPVCVIREWGTWSARCAAARLAGAVVPGDARVRRVGDRPAGAGRIGRRHAGSLSKGMLRECVEGSWAAGKSQPVLGRRAQRTAMRARPARAIRSSGAGTKRLRVGRQP
jgi:hypothetical protein